MTTRGSLKVRSGTRTSSSTSNTAAGTVTVWDGKKNEIFWKMDGCGPSAVLPTTAGEFLVTCYDSNTIGRNLGRRQDAAGL